MLFRSERFDALVDRRGTNSIPLLKLDDNRAWDTTGAVPCEHHVQALRRQRQLILNDHSLVAQITEFHDRRHTDQRVLPRANFGLRRPEAEVFKEAVGEGTGKLVALGLVDEVDRRSAIQMHDRSLAWAATRFSAPRTITAF